MPDIKVKPCSYSSSSKESSSKLLALVKAGSQTYREEALRREVEESVAPEVSLESQIREYIALSESY